jgi:hypothetical protein
MEHKYFDYIAGFVLFCNIINLFLPPWERFTEWPKFQSIYKLLCVFIGYWCSVHFKSKLWPEISVQNQINKILNGEK